MLIDFTVENFKSFKEETVFSMETDKKDILEDTNTISIRQNKRNHKKKLLKSAVLFGANASGKSNFISILAAFRYYLFVKGKNKFRNDDFRFSDEKKYTKMEINILINEKIYNYILELDFKNKVIVSEIFYIIDERKDVPVYKRENSKIIFYDKKIFSDYETTIKFINENLNDSDSILTRLSEYRKPEEIEDFIEYLDNMMIWNSEISIREIGKLFYENKKSKKNFIDYLKKFGFSIDDIEITKEKEDENILKIIENVRSSFTGKEGNKIEMPEIDYKYNLKFIYKKNKNESYSLNLSEQSTGTQKMIKLFLPIYNVLSNGGILIIDELDESLHYKLIYDIIKMFNSVNVNKKNAQIIFTTHNLLLLDLNIFRRDQIWFVENKEIFKGTELYSLSDINGVRKDSKILRDYLNGYFGGVPDIKKFGVNLWLEKREKIIKENK